MESEEFQTNEFTEKRFSSLLFMLRTGGINIYTRNVSKMRRVFTISLFMLSLFVYLGLILDIIFSEDNMKEVMKTLRIVVPTAATLTIEFSFRIRRNVYNDLIDYTKIFVWEDLPQRDIKNGKLTAAGLIPYIHKIVKMVLSFVVITHIIQSSVRVFFSREVIFKAWYPFDMFSSPYYEITLIAQILATVVWLTAYFGLPYLYAICICIACSQIDKIKEILIHIKENNKLPIHYEKTQNSEQYPYRRMQCQLNECIRIHQNVIRFLYQLEKALCLPLCGVLLFLQMALCIASFSAVITWGDNVELIQSILVYFTVLCSVGVYCCLGTMITEKFESVKDAAWASDWVGAPVEYQRCILFIIAQANHGFNLTAGKFVPLSNKTLMSMMNESLSLFMFLLTMKDKNESMHGELTQ